MDLLTDDEIVTNLILPIWDAMDRNKKNKIGKGIWDWFSTRLKFAANVRELKKFYDILCDKLELSPSSEEQKLIHATIASGYDDHILNEIRKNGNLYILKLQLITSLRKEEFAAKNAKGVKMARIIED